MTLPLPPALDVKCWTAGLHQQILNQTWRSSSLILPSEKARSTLATTGRRMVERFPLTHMMADLNKEKHTRHLSQNTQRLQFVFHFSPNSLTLSSQVRRFSNSLVMQHRDKGDREQQLAKGLNTLMSKNARCLFRPQKSRATTLRRAPSSRLAVA